MRTPTRTLLTGLAATLERVAEVAEENGVLEDGATALDGLLAHHEES
jgi:hypothetical protein